MTGNRRPVAELAQAYLKHYQTRADMDFWAFDEVLDRVTHDSAHADDAWDLVQALVRLAPDEALGYVAAGPVEEFVRHFGAEQITQLELTARRDPKFRAALGLIWLDHEDLPSDILERLVIASEGQIRPL